jgi:hypothetical protein
VKKAEAEGKPLPEKRALQRGTKGPGSLVAFYAAQSFEEAPELPLPEGAAADRENFYGLFSWSIVQALEQRQSPLTYRELARLVAGRYRAARGTRPPTPFADGDLDREVLGLNVWPRRSDVVLRRGEDGLRINAGALLGLTPGSVLALHPPAGDARGEKPVLGYVRVESAAPTTATVVPCAHAGTLALPADKVEDHCRCELVSRDFGDMRVKLFAGESPALKAALGKTDREVRDMVLVVPKEADAEWVLRAVTSKQAEELYHLKGLKEDQVLLLQGDGGQRPSLEEKLRAPGWGVVRRKVFGVYPAGSEKELAGALERDLPKIFKWQNLWRIAAGIHGEDGGRDYGLKLEVLALHDENDRKGQPVTDGVLRDGMEVAYVLRNDGSDPLWVTALYLDANLGIQKVFSRALEPEGGPIRFLQAKMSTRDGSWGLEGMVVFAIPQPVHRVQPDFSFLEQPPLAVADARRGSPRAAPDSPFGRLLAAAAFNAGTRGHPPRVPTTPAVVSQSWVLLNKP